MMKNIALASVTAAVLIFSGCSTKEPAIDATANNASSSGASTLNPNTVATTSTPTTGGADSGNVIAPITNINPNDSTTASNTAVVNGSDGALASIYFDYDKFDVRDDMQETMGKNSALVKNKSVKLEGNCDEFGSDEYNIALGLKRAAAIKSALVDGGMNPDSISMVSFGEGNPVCLEKTQECWAKNRRVDFKLP